MPLYNGIHVGYNADLKPNFGYSGHIFAAHSKEEALRIMFTKGKEDYPEYSTVLCDALEVPREIIRNSPNNIYLCIYVGCQNAPDGSISVHYATEVCVAHSKEEALGYILVRGKKDYPGYSAIICDAIKYSVEWLIILLNDSRSY